MARKSKYDECVAPHIDKIKDWVAAGATMAEIAESLGIAESTLYEYKKDKKELSEAFSRGRKEVVIEIKAALLKKALGFYYDETRNSLKKDDKNGETLYTETTHRYCPPSETAAAMLLRNYAEDWRDNDNVSVKFKRQEAELKRKIAQANNFIDLDEGE